MPLEPGNLRDLDKDPVAGRVLEVVGLLDDKSGDFGGQDDALSHYRLPGQTRTHGDQP